MRDFWTAERISVLQELWAGGATAEAIAVEIGGVSRSAVLGKIYRLRHAGKPTAAPEIRATARRTKQRVPRLKPPCVEPKGLLDLTNDSCRWPVAGASAGGIWFCGAPEADLAGGMPYCPYHAQRAYVIPPVRVAAAQRTAAPAAKQSGAAKPRHRYVWRAPVRHPASRWR